MFGNEGCFRENLLRWFKSNRRDYPWRHEREPYKVIISEVMLQKTNADRVAEVYSKFVERFPDLQSLVRSEDQELMHIMQPLGLHYKASRLKGLAKLILGEFGGAVPSEKRDLLMLPGVGEYIANAVLCFGFSKRVPLVDSNVVSLYQRILGFQSVKKRPREDEKIWNLAENMLPLEHYQEYNWALLDFCAKICCIRRPKCDSCPVSVSCSQLRSERVFIAGKHDRG